MFNQKGQVTDVQLKYTKEGVFRKFGFIGFQNDSQANAAIQFFNNTCIDTSRISVEVCASLGADDKPQSWSKHAKDSSIHKKLHGIEDENKSKDNDKQKKKNKKERLEEIYGEHKNDPKFIEFMKVHGKNSDIWDNDLGSFDPTDGETTAKTKEAPVKTEKKKAKTESFIEEDNVDDGEGDDAEEGDAQSETDDIEKKLANQEISDSDYLKSLMNKKPAAAKEKATTSGDSEKKVTNLYTIKIREIPFKTKRQDIIKFFRPVKAFSIRLPTRKHGFCYVGFKTEKEFNKAMLKNRSFLKGKQVLFTDFTEKNKEAANKKNSEGEASESQSKKSNPKWAKQEEALKNEEDISESGRIFFRNLSYTVTDDQIQQLFEKYGPVTEVNLPIDTLTRKIKGFGTVTYVMPEHAVRAFSELDGSTFHGRMLHLIPGKSKNDDDDPDTEGLSFKQKKELKQKQTAGSSHNWNSLFMGSDAVANMLAQNYQTTKEAILDTAGGGSSAAVRLALGETELIMGMRKFLESHDVVLDAFNQAPKKRSKTAILVKNLPANTMLSEIQPLFAKFGLLGRVVLPPSGITAIVEFLDAGEAKKAFSKLAYTKFKNLPLYLEWAPENTFKAAATEPMKEVAAENEEGKTENDTKPRKPNAFSKNRPTVASGKTEPEVPESYVLNEPMEEHESNNNETNDNDNENEDVEPEPETTLFLRNLNFATVEETIRRHFKHIGPIHHIQVAQKKDPENPRNRISLGYGFIQFKKKASAEKALKTMLITNIDDKAVELKRSDRTLQ